MNLADQEGEIPFEKEHADELVSIFIASNCLALRLVDDHDFAALLSYLRPQYKLPSRRTLGDTLLPALADNIEKTMLAKMQRISTFALTIDSWTSGANRSYMSVTAHGITKAWSFESFFLALVPVKQSETSEYISDMVTEVLTDWNIHKHNRASCTTDGAANARNATTLLGIPWVYCV